MVKLFELLTKKSAIKILLWFMENSSNEFYEHEVRNKTKISRGSSIKWLRQLAEDGFLIRRSKGRLILYRLNSENPLVKELKSLCLNVELIEEE